MEEYLGSVCGISITVKAHKKIFTYIYAHDNVHIQICCIYSVHVYILNFVNMVNSKVFSYYPVGLA